MFAFCVDKNKKHRTGQTKTVNSDYCNYFHSELTIAAISMVNSVVHGGPWRRGKIPPCGAVIADYRGKIRNSSRNLPLQRAQKPPCKSAIAAMAGQFDNTNGEH